MVTVNGELELSDDATGHLLQHIFGAQEPEPGAPFTHTLKPPETEEEMWAEPPASFTLEEAACAQCGATGELERTVYDRWQCVDLAGCAKRQLARRP